MSRLEIRRPTLSIGDVAERTGLTPAALRMWEIRYGFPTPVRLDSGHRRYDAGQVDTVLEVLRRRETGLRLDVAIEQAVRSAADISAPRRPRSTPSCAGCTRGCTRSGCASRP